MYAVIAIGLMVVLPLVSIGVDFLVAHGATDVFHLIGKWFAFWGIGVRLLIAGVNQVARPGFTAKGIFKITDPAAETIVTELGYANVAFGLIGILSLPFPALFLTSAIVAGGLFLALDGLLHVRSKEPQPERDHRDGDRFRHPDHRPDLPVRDLSLTHRMAMAWNADKGGAIGTRERAGGGY